LVDEKQQFFKREEVRTMAKDIAQLREEEAKKESERIAGLKPPTMPSQKRQGAEHLPTTPSASAPETLPLAGQAGGISPEPRKIEPAGQQEPRPWPKTASLQPPSLSDRLIIRVGVVFIVIMVFTNLFLFWNWYAKEQWLKKPAKIPGEQPVNQQLPPSEEPAVETTAAPVVSPSLILTQATTTLEIASTADLSSALANELKKNFSQAPFTRLLIKNTTEEKYLVLKDFLGQFTTTDLDVFYKKLSPDFTLFIYSQEQGNRPGFIAKIIEKEGLAAFLLTWQKTMESDLAKFYAILGKQGPALSPYFRKTSYKGAEVYYQTFSKEDLGICYALQQDYFILTTSWQGLLRTIDNLIF
jgi:hypothetical protein